MFDIPGLNLKNLTDDQLLERSLELSRKIAWASNQAGNNALELMYNITDAINAEIRERAFMQRWERNGKAMSQPINTDPVFNNLDNPQVGDKGKLPKYIGIRRPVATKTPVKPEDNK